MEPRPLKILAGLHGREKGEPGTTDCAFGGAAPPTQRAGSRSRPWRRAFAHRSSSPPLPRFLPKQRRWGQEQPRREAGRSLSPSQAVGSSRKVPPRYRTHRPLPRRSGGRLKGWVLSGTGPPVFPEKSFGRTPLSSLLSPSPGVEIRMHFQGSIGHGRVRFPWRGINRRGRRPPHFPVDGSPPA